VPPNLSSLVFGAGVALVGLGLAWRGGKGRAVVWLALGLVLGWWRMAPGDGMVEPRSDRSVVAHGRVSGHWRQLGESWSAPWTVERWTQRGASGSKLEGYLVLPVEVSAVDRPPLGARVRVKGYLRQSARLANVPRSEPGAWRLRVKSLRLVEQVGRPPWWARRATALRQRLETALEEGGHPATEGQGRALARALLLGDASHLPAAWVQGLRRLGLAHVLAVSGVHVGMLVGLLSAGLWLMPGRWLRVVPLLGLALVVVATGLYLAVVGPRPSLLRSAVMAVAGAATLVVERPPNSAQSIGIAALLVLGFDPAAIDDLSFRLTFGATLGIVLYGLPLARRWADSWGSRGLGRGVLGTLAVSLGAQLGSMPWALPVFRLLTPWAPVANLVAVPWAAVSLLASISWMALALGSPELARDALPLLDTLAAPWGWPAELGPSRWIAWPVVLGPWAALVLVVVLGVLAWWPRRGLAALVVVAVLTSFVAVLRPGPSDHGVDLVMIDVGQGDSILLRDGPRTLLVDGGGWPAGDLGSRVLLPVLADLGLRRLDAVLLTHGDQDHCGGLLDLSGVLALGEVWTGEGVTGDCANELVSVVPAHRTLVRGDRLTVGRWSLEVLHPPVGEDLADASSNDASLVLRAEAFGRRVLLTGDVEAAGERELLRHDRGALAADVLKVAHHGSRSSSQLPFLAAVEPRIALVPVGRGNPYGHPADDVLQRLDRRRIHIVRTDRHGIVHLIVRPSGSLALDLPAWGGDSID
jgi:competence protein ComEC